MDLYKISNWIYFYSIRVMINGEATCCRGCIQKWNGHEKAKPLNENEVDNIVELIMEGIEK